MFNLIDLDEAHLKCYNRNSALFLREAIICYKSGAFRSAIVTTWNCLFFDLVEKIREVSLAGDAAALEFYQKFENGVTRGDISHMLATEKQILKLARDNFEFFSDIELIDLTRIQEDRNRCAHPTINAAGEIFQPSAELARTHIVCAIDHVLSHPPSHGKNALNRLLEDIKSPLFPHTIPLAVSALEHSTLVRARKSLARNFVSVMIKIIVVEQDHRYVARAKAALRAYSKINFAVYIDTVAEEASKVFRNLADKDLSRGVSLIHLERMFWESLAADQKQRLVAFFENLRGTDLDLIETTLNISELDDAAIRCANRLQAKHIDENFWFILPRVLIDRLILLYGRAHSEDHANSVSKVIQNNISDFSLLDASQLIAVAVENEYVAGCIEHQALLHKLKQRYPSLINDLSSLSDDL